MPKYKLIIHVPIYLVNDVCLAVNQDDKESSKNVNDFTLVQTVNFFQTPPRPPYHPPSQSVKQYLLVHKQTQYKKNIPLHFNMPKSQLLIELETRFKT